MCIRDSYYADLASKTSDETQNDVPAWKGWFSLIVLLLCIVGFVLTDQAAFKPYINVAVVALIGATVLITSGCMPLKKTLAEMDWNTLVILAAAQGFAKGLDVSGGGKVIADAVLNLFGGQEASTAVLMAVGVIVTTIPVSYTHLDVYKRQPSSPVRSSLPGCPPGPLPGRPGQ